MRVVIQRVDEASVIVDHEEVGKINKGLLIFLGITDADNHNDIQWLIKKIINLRIFNDENGKMNLSLVDVTGEVLIVSQFTLYASTKKGNRPSYLRSAKPNIAIPLYEAFIDEFRLYKIQPEEGIFGANMQVHFINNGPVTISIDTKDKE
ncbi:MAG: D-aminoacyl-tRNA deacylase [Saprospiraceae bacterium]